MEDQLKQILRRLDSQEKTLNLLYKDRELMEEISIRLGKVEDQVRYLADRIEKMEKTNKTESKDVLEEVQQIKDHTEEITKIITE